MKNFTLVELNLRNFKGVKEFSLKADGNDLVVKGGNATGKTTLFDSFTWLLFGKDSMNRSNFDIKTLDGEGEVAQHGLDHEVEGTFKIDGEEITFKRVYSENWVRKRGSATETFSGHTTTYFIDDVTVKKKEYEERVATIVSEDTFKLITNPMYFNEQLDWKDRRQILLDIAGGITNEEIAEGNKDLEGFLEKLKGKDVEAHKKSITSKQRTINKELDKIPIRIDEIDLSMPEVDGLDRSSIETIISNLSEAIEDKQKESLDIRSGVQINDKQRELSEVELQLNKIETLHGHDIEQQIISKKAGVQEIESNVKNLASQIEREQANVTSHQGRINVIGVEVTELRQEWSKVSKVEFVHEHEHKCPTCSQELPQDQLEDARTKAEEIFKLNKANQLEAITSKAKAKKEESEQSQTFIDRINRDIEKLTSEIESQEKRAERLKRELDNLQNEVTPITENQEYVTASEIKKEIISEIEQLSESQVELLEPIQQEIKALEEKRGIAQTDLSKFDQIEKAKERIKELEGQEKALVTEYEQLEREVFLSDQFIIVKVNSLEEKINAKFNHAKFKLFNEQINGGLEETCITTFEGVPYNSGLNNASRINVGLDIINTLNAHYGVNTPIFIDNAESVVNLLEIEAQTIGLRVADTEVMEVEKNNSKGVA